MPGFVGQCQISKHTYYANVVRMPLFVSTNATFVTVNLYPQPPEVVVAFAVDPGLARPNGVSMSPHMQDPGCDFPRILLPRTSVNKACRRAGAATSPGRT